MKSEGGRCTTHTRTALQSAVAAYERATEQLDAEDPQTRKKLNKARQRVARWAREYDATPGGLSELRSRLESEDDPARQQMLAHRLEKALEMRQRAASESATTAKRRPLTDEQYRTHLGVVEERLNAALAAGEATDHKYTLDERGTVWAPERAKVQREIVDHLYARASHVPCEGRVVIAGGLGGAGKSTVLKGHATISPEQYMTINPDDVKEEMARRKLIPRVEGLTPMEASTLVHEESSHIANMLARKCYAKKMNVIWDITMSSHGSTTRRLKELRQAGYTKVEAVFVDIPVETSVRRALARHRRGLEKYRNGESLGGRYVPPQVIRKKAHSEHSTANRAVFEDLKDEFDQWTVYDNSVDGRKPMKLKEKQSVQH